LYTHGFSLVIGSRFAPGGTTGFSFVRRLLSLVGNWLIRFVGGLPRLRDCTSGYRCISANLIQECDFSHLSTRGYSFQSSFLFELLRNGARVVEIPIIFSARLYGESKLSFRDQLEFLTNLGRIRFRKSHDFVRFCVTGTSGVVVNMGGYILLTRLLGTSMEIASPIAIETSVLSNFFLYNAWGFLKGVERHESYRIGKLIRFHTVAAFGAVVNYSLLLLLVRMFGWWDTLANLGGILVGTLLNYCMNSVWTWKEVRDKEPQTARSFSSGVNKDPSPLSTQRGDSYSITGEIRQLGKRRERRISH
jgi:dolichol-phosphate mannosyltransferase